MIWDLLHECRVSGGSAANVVKGLANISAGQVHCKFVGMIGADAVGAEYTLQLRQQGVQPLLLVSLAARIIVALSAGLSEAAAAAAQLTHARWCMLVRCLMYDGYWQH